MAINCNGPFDFNGEMISFATKTEAQEFSALVTEISNLNFSKASDVSHYIVRNKLGQKYPNISGVVTMRAQSHNWEFVGGFPTKIYRALCRELKLTTNGSHARVIDFKPFAQMAA
jgi:hypothetical protein